MSMDSTIRNMTLMGSGLLPYRTNVPSQYGDKQTQYFSSETKTFIQKYARYASDYVEARIEGLDPDKPEEWQAKYIRMADLVGPRAAFTRRIDDYKLILFADRKIEYIRPGTKIETMGSVWLVSNPVNLSGGDGAGIMERCDAVWNYLDYYGNIQSEPLAFQNERANASDSDSQQSMYISKGYFNVLCQYNDFTRQLDTNSRALIGGKAYRVTGFPPLLREFTMDKASARLLQFVLRFEEPNGEIDDLENDVAGGKSFRWEILIQGRRQFAVGESGAFTASSERNGETVDESEHDVTYLWQSGDPSVLTVDESGAVEAVGIGTCSLFCTLAQNPEISSEIVVEVTETSEEGDYIAFVSEVPEMLTAFDSCEIEAAYYENGARTSEQIAWSFTGARPGSWSATDHGDGSVTLRCYGYSPEPLSVTASYSGKTVSATVRLTGI